MVDQPPSDWFSRREKRPPHLGEVWGPIEHRLEFNVPIFEATIGQCLAATLIASSSTAFEAIDP